MQEHSKKCEVCFSDFVPKQKWAKYCSPECRALLPCNSCGGGPRVSSMAICKECDKIRRKAKYDANPKREIEKVIAWNRQNRERINANNRARYASNEKMREVHKKWKRDNKDKVKEHHQRKHAARRSHLDNVGRSLTPAQWQQILEDYDHACVYCGSKSSITKDHFWPLKLGGAHEPENIVPACRSCNSQKSGRNPFDFCHEKGVEIVVTEATIQSEILIAVSALPNCLIWRQNAGAVKMPNGSFIRVGPAGCADIIGCLNGRALAIEVKAPKGRQAPSQVRFEAAWKNSGGIYILARSAEEALAGIEGATNAS